LFIGNSGGDFKLNLIVFDHCSIPIQIRVVGEDHPEKEVDKNIT